MSRAQQYSRYEPVSYDNAPSYPQWEVPSGARKEMPSTGVSLMQSPTNDFQSPPGVSEPNYHHADSRSPSMFSRLLRDWWLIEILVWLVALGSMAVMLYFLRKYDQKPKSDWPFSLTVNAFLQIFTTMLRGAILMPVAQSISQLKYTWFTSSSRSLEDFGTFDDASRGIWGSLRLIWRQKAARLASLGALVTILTLATSTFVQQAVSFPIRLTKSSNGTAMSQINTGYHDMEGVFDATPSFGSPSSAMKGAFYSGLLGSYTAKIQPLSPLILGRLFLFVADLAASLTGPTSDQEATIMLSNGDNFTTYPDFMTIRISDDLNAEWANGDYVVNRTSIAFRAVQNPIADFSVIGSTGPNAVECLLQFCVQNFSTSVVNGVAKTTVLQSQTAASLGITFDPTSFRNVEDDSASDSVWTGHVLPGTDIRNLYIGSSDSADTFSSAMRDSNHTRGTELLMENIATAMTNNIRTSAGSSNVTGTAYESIAYIHVEWKWLGFPIALLVLSFLFLLATVIKSQFSSVGIWKGSTLATMQILSEETRRELGPLSSNSRMMQVAKEKEVKLRNGRGVWSM